MACFQLLSILLYLLSWANRPTLSLVFNIPAPIEPFFGRQELLDKLHHLATAPSMSLDPDPPISNSTSNSTDSDSSTEIPVVDDQANGQDNETAGFSINQLLVLDGSAPYRVIGLHGPSGVGKKQLTLQLISILRKKQMEVGVQPPLIGGDSINSQKNNTNTNNSFIINSFKHFIWLNGHSEQTLEDSFLALASHPKLQLQVKSTTNSTSIQQSQKQDQGQTQNQAPVSEVIAHIYKNLCHEPTFFVIDLNLQTRTNYNRNISTFLRPFLPPNGTTNPTDTCSPPVFFTLIHTKKPAAKLIDRNEIRPVIAKLLEIPKLSEQEATEWILQGVAKIQRFDSLLQKSKSSENKEEAKKMGELLKGFPLVIHQALSYIQQEGPSDDKEKSEIQDFTECFTQLQIEFMGGDPFGMGMGMGMGGMGMGMGMPRHHGDPRAKPKKPKSPSYLMVSLVKEKLEADSIDQEEARKALEIMEMMIFLPVEHPPGIRLEFLLDILNDKKMTNSKEEGEKGQLVIMKALQILEKHAIIFTKKNRGGFIDTIEMHRATQKIVLKSHRDERGGRGRGEMDEHYGRRPSYMDEERYLERMGHKRKISKLEQRRKKKEGDLGGLDDWSRGGRGRGRGRGRYTGYESHQRLNKHLDFIIRRCEIFLGVASHKPAIEKKKDFGIRPDTNFEDFGNADENEGEIETEDQDSLDDEEYSEGNRIPRDLRLGSPGRMAKKKDVEFPKENLLGSVNPDKSGELKKDLLENANSTSKTTEIESPLKNKSHSDWLYYLKTMEMTLEKMEYSRPRDFDLLKILELKTHLALNMEGRRAWTLSRQIFSSVKKVRGIQDDGGARSRIAGILNRLKEGNVGNSGNKMLPRPSAGEIGEMALEILSESARFTPEILRNIGLEPKSKPKRVEIVMEEPEETFHKMIRDEL